MMKQEDPANKPIKKAKRKIAPRHKPAAVKKKFDPPFVPTQQMRDDVKTMAALGMPEKAIAILIRNPATNNSIDINTLRKHFDGEILQGAANAYRSTLMNLFRMSQSRQVNPTVLAAIEKTLKIMGKRFEDPEDDIEQLQKTEVTVNIDNRSQIAFTKEDLFKLPKEDLRRLNEIRQTILSRGESPL